MQSNEITAELAINTAINLFSVCKQSCFRTRISTISVSPARCGDTINGRDAIGTSSTTTPITATTHMHLLTLVGHIRMRPMITKRSDAVGENYSRAIIYRTKKFPISKCDETQNMIVSIARRSHAYTHKHSHALSKRTNKRQAIKAYIVMHESKASFFNRKFQELHNYAKFNMYKCVST